jgi:hypothetical protein
MKEDARGTSRERATGYGDDAGPCPVLVQTSPPDPDLARLVAAWPDLPPHIRAAVLALVDSTHTTR